MIEYYWKTYAEALHGFLLKRCGARALADDLLQEVFLRAQERHHQLQQPEKARAWLFQVARNALHDHYRVQQRQQRHLEAYQFVAQQAEKGEAFKNCCSADDCLPILVQHLDEPYRQALLQTAYGTMGQKEYAQTYGLNYATAKSHIQRARQQLRLYVQLYCPSLLPEQEQASAQPCCAY